METLEILSDYELERNKPLPNTTHSVLQSNLVFELRQKSFNQFRILSELALDTVPNGSTPDLVIYPYFEVDFGAEYPSRRSDPPLLTIEIQSPSQSLDEMVDKANVYFAFGVKSCWIVQPRIKAILVFSQPNQYNFYQDGDLLKDPNLNIELNLSHVFA